MRSLDARTLLGLFLLAGFVSLASPGVRVIRADPGPEAGAAQAGAGGVCRAGEAPDGASQLSATLEPVRRQAEVQIATGDEDSEGLIVLNGRGYNYAAPPAVDTAAILREIEIRKLESR